MGLYLINCSLENALFYFTIRIHELHKGNNIVRVDKKVLVLLTVSRTLGRNFKLSNDTPSNKGFIMEDEANVT